MMGYFFGMGQCPRPVEGLPDDLLVPVLGCQVQRGGVVGVGGILGLSLQEGDAQMAVQQQLGHLHGAQG